MRTLQISLIVWAIASALLPAQQATTTTYLGYAYPAGGRQGDTFTVLLGGRYLRDPQSIIVSGEGITAEVLQHYPALAKINGVRMKMLRMRIAERELELNDEPIPGWIERGYKQLTDAEKEKDAMPANALFDRIEEMDTNELTYVKEVLKDYNERQFSGQIAEQVRLEVSIAKNAPVGNRELRLAAKAGLSNPIRFQVSRLPEQPEAEPNDAISSYSPTLGINRFPTLINGQVMPGDVDRFLIRTRRGQRIVFDLMARRLIPYVADAVPGWFQATLALFDAEGTRLAYVDDTYGDPDPRLEYTFDQSGTYIVEVRDAIYRGSENFVYRLHMTEVAVEENEIREEDVDYTHHELDYTKEKEPNNHHDQAGYVKLPRVIVGHISAKGDIDSYSFDGLAGTSIIAEIEARYFDSPMDSLIRLLDEEGNVLAMNDDYVSKREHLHMGPGLMTHYADSYLTHTLPEDGRYWITVEDVQRNGGKDYKYRLRLSKPRPDFDVRITPSSLNAGATACVDFRIYANRQDGYTGPIQLELVDPPAGVRLHNAVIPSGQGDTCATLEWRPGKQFDVINLQLQAIGQQDDHTISRPVVAADNNMQAFLWRHLVPAQALQIMAMTNYKIFAYTPEACEGHVQLTHSTTASLQLPLSNNVKNAERFRFRLKDAPDGIQLTSGKLRDKAIHLEFKCTDALTPEHRIGNLIIEVLDNSRKGKSKNMPIGVLPAIAYTVTES